MGVITTGQTFASGDQVTATKLNDIANSATFTSAADTTDNSTLTLSPSSKLKVADAGITATQLATDSVITAKIQDGAVTSAKLDAAAVSVLMPTGSIMPYAGTSAPTGYLFCDGDEYDQTGTYANLFSTIQNTYNTGGETANYFRVPDLQGRVIAGRDNMSGTSANRLIGTISGLNGDNLGAAGGEEGVTLTAAQSGLPDHTHTHLRQTNGQMADGSFNVPNINANALSTSGVTGGAQDASSAHSSVQPTIILNYIIKT